MDGRYKVTLSTVAFVSVPEKGVHAEEAKETKQSEQIIDVDKNKYVEFLFDISKEMKLFYETPVIFLAQKDYSDTIFDAMCNIRRALGEKHSRRNIIDSIVDAHIAWLKAVDELEKFLSRVNEVKTEEICQAVTYTIDAMALRLKYYKRYMENHKKSLSNAELANLAADLEIVEEMHKDTISALMEKLKCFKNSVCDSVFITHVKDALDELLHWLDKIYDVFSFLLSKYMHFNVEHLSTDLTKTLQQIVDNLKGSDSPSVQKILEEFKSKGRELSQLVRGTAGHGLEICKVVEKISVLEDRINRLEHEPLSAAVMALKHKKEYLEKRLASLEKLKTTISNIHHEADLHFEDEAEEGTCSCEDFFQLRIFNHLLPSEERDNLISELCYLWDLALFGERTRKSIVSILSATDVREEFTDELGTFFVDENGRKIYKKLNDETLYQPNENNELVPLTDDADHVFFYDECGRYYLDPKTRDRIYKASDTASEYMMDYSGVLLKVKEVRDGVTYYYDNYGRYYINEQGKFIYRETDAISEYENDGMGNLVRIRSHLDMLETCPPEVNVTADFKYLTENVGMALRICIADVIMHQPADPVKYLAERLIKYRENIELRDKWAREKEELDAERAIYAAEELAAKERAAKKAFDIDGGSEASYDSNLVMYKTIPNNAVSEDESEANK